MKAKYHDNHDVLQLFMIFFFSFFVFLFFFANLSFVACMFQTEILIHDPVYNFYLLQQVFMFGSRSSLIQNTILYRILTCHLSD